MAKASTYLFEKAAIDNSSATPAIMVFTARPSSYFTRPFDFDSTLTEHPFVAKAIIAAITYLATNISSTDSMATEQTTAKDIVATPIDFVEQVIIDTASEPNCSCFDCITASLQAIGLAGPPWTTSADSLEQLSQTLESQ